MQLTGYCVWVLGNPAPLFPTSLERVSRDTHRAPQIARKTTKISTQRNKRKKKTRKRVVELLRFFASCLAGIWMFCDLAGLRGAFAGSGTRSSYLVTLAPIPGGIAATRA